MTATNAADGLEGSVLPGGWTVLSRIHPRPGDTGGNFSINYWAIDATGRRGFCKVLNYWWLFSAQTTGVDPLEAIAAATRIYQFERDLARECVGLSRVITALDDGSFRRDGYTFDLVSFIIFEVAEGDIRRVLDEADRFDVALRLRTIHNLATGVRQLHQRQVAHQDLKPSNTLVFAQNQSGRRVSKVGDLGRATVVGRPMDHDDYIIAGDPSYAPPEGLYGSQSDGFGPRRAACDIYQLGSMLSFVFTGLSFNAYLHQQLHPSQNWNNWTGTYAEVFPYVEDAYCRSVEAISEEVPLEIRTRVVALLQALCHPDPLRRGHPRSQVGLSNSYSLDRIVTELDLLSRLAEIRLRSAS